MRHAGNTAFYITTIKQQGVLEQRIHLFLTVDRGMQHSFVHRDEKIFRLDTVAGGQRQLSEFEHGLRRETVSIQLPRANG